MAKKQVKKQSKKQVVEKKVVAQKEKKIQRKLETEKNVYGWKKDVKDIPTSEKGFAPTIEGNHVPFTPEEMVFTPEPPKNFVDDLLKQYGI